MKRNVLTLVVGVILLIIFFLLLFTFQVRQTEVVVVTTFAKPSAEPITEPGLYFKWPVPIQRIYRFDKRIHNFEDGIDQMLTSDGHNLLASVYVGWTIEKPLDFFNSFPAGTPQAAEPQLQRLVRSTKQAVIGKHAFSDFISSTPGQARFIEIEKEILAAIHEAALNRYGIDVRFVGIKQLGIPESVTQKVFDRMTAERQREIDRLTAIGESEAISIRSVADRDRQEILSKAEAEAYAIRGEADAQAMKHFETFRQNPELAVFLMELTALEKTLGKGSTIVADSSMTPFNLLSSAQTNRFQNRPESESSTVTDAPPRTLSSAESSNN